MCEKERNEKQINRHRNGTRETEKDKKQKLTYKTTQKITHISCLILDQYHIDSTSVNILQYSLNKKNCSSL